jgi:predicted DNA-binding protein
MKQAHRFFNLLLPFKTYEELKVMSTKTEKPVAVIIRKGIDYILKSENFKRECNDND